jgi:hypothetical protein
VWDRATAYADLNSSACWSWPHPQFAIVCERPSSIHGELVNPAVTRGWGSHRLHNTSGPSIEWAGFALWHIHGVAVTEQIVMAPHTLTVKQIDVEKNAEVRRVMIERFGTARYIKDSGAKVVQELPANYFIKGLQTARLLVKTRKDDTPIVMVDILNSTPEPDGTTKRYMLRVQPDAYDGLASKDCHAAIASTWRNQDNSLYFKRPQDYRPGWES